MSADLPGIVAVYNHWVEHSAASFELVPVPIEDRRDWFRDHSRGGRHRILVAEGEAGGLDGWASTSQFRPRRAYDTTVESSVYVRPGTAGRGIGTALYAELFRAVADEDIARIVAGVSLPNPASIALHRRFGFRHVGTFTSVGRKFGRYWDVAWYERPLRVDGAGPEVGDPATAAVTTSSPRPSP